jgi:hypothetical protein
MSADSIPVVQDVTFRLSQSGDMVGVDFECRDGQTRSLALSVAASPKVLAGFLWAGAESAGKRPAPAISQVTREAMQDGARTVSGYRVTTDSASGDRVLELRCGAGAVCVRVDAAMADEIAHALFGDGVAPT